MLISLSAVQAAVLILSVTVPLLALLLPSVTTDQSIWSEVLQASSSPVKFWVSQAPHTKFPFAFSLTMGFATWAGMLTGIAVFSSKFKEQPVRQAQQRMGGSIRIGMSIGAIIMLIAIFTKEWDGATLRIAKIITTHVHNDRLAFAMLAEGIYFMTTGLVFYLLVEVKGLIKGERK